RRRYKMKGMSCSRHCPHHPFSFPSTLNLSSSMPPRASRRGGSRWWPPTVDLSYRRDHQRLANALAAIDSEAIVELSALTVHHREMGRAQLRSHVVLLRGLASSEPAVPWATARQYVVGAVTGMVAAYIDPFGLLGRANLVLRHIRRRDLADELEVGEVTREGPHSDVVEYLLDLIQECRSHEG